MADVGPSEETIPIEVVQPSTGRRGTYHAPKQWSTDQIDAKLGELKAERVKTWGEWTYDHVVPKTPTEWAILGATAAPALLTGGAAVVPSVVGKQALRGAAETIGGTAIRRMATTMAAGGAASIYEPSLQKEDPSKRFARGSLEGGVAAGIGELAAVPTTYATKWWVDKWVRTANAARVGKQLGQLDEVLKNDGTASDLFRVAFMNGTDEAASQLYVKGLQGITARDTSQGLHSPALTKMVQKMGMKDILPSPAAGNDFYRLDAAFDILHEAGQFAFEAGQAKDTSTARVLQRLREQVYEDLKTHWKGTGLMEDFAAVNGRYARQKRGLELLRDNWQQVFPRGRSEVDLAQVTENLIQRMAETGPTTRAQLKDDLNGIWREFFRGRDPGARDLPGVSPSLRGGRMGYGRPSAFFGLGSPPYRAGTTETLETLIPSTAETLGGTLMRQKMMKEMERKNLEERIFGPRPVGGVPG